MARVNHKTGKPASPKDRDVILEAFKIGENWRGKIKGTLDGSDDARQTDETEEEEQPNNPDKLQNRINQIEEIDDNIPDIGSVF